MLPDDQPTIPTAPPNGSRPAQLGWQAPSVEQMQAMLSQYDILDILGRGGMGAVYKGRQKSLKRLVAIKILPLGMADDEMKFAERFENEAQTMAAMNHPAIVAVYDFGETSDGLLYFIMEFVDGTDVQKMIQASGKLSGEYALAITAHVCDALHYAHSRGVIHRDIKPANILIDQEGHVKVADFGLAKMSDPSQTSGLTKTNMAMGTPDYVAPEVLTTGMVADHRADIYAVGVMLYQMLTGEVPRGMFKLPSQKGIGCDPRFDDIIHKAMEQDREERYQSAMDVRRALDVILTTPQPKDDGTGIVPVKDIPQKPVAKGPRPPGEKNAPSQKPAQKAAAAPKAKAPPKKQSPAAMWLSIGGIVAVLGVAGFFILGGKPKPQASATTDNASATVPSARPQPPFKVLENPNVPAAESRKPSAATASEAGAIKLYASSDQLPVRSGVSWDNGAVRLDKTALVYTGLHSRDAILRAEIKMNPDRSSPRLSLRHPSSSNSKGLIYSVVAHGKDGTIKFDFTDASGGIKQLQEWSLPRRYGADEWMTLELRAVGDEFTVSADGNVLGTVRDSTHEEAGTASLWANANGFFRNIIFVPLDKPVPTPGKGKTIDLLALVDLKRDVLLGEWERTADGLVKKGAGNISGDSPRVQFRHELPPEYDVEFEFTPAKGTQALGLVLSAESRTFSWLLGGGTGQSAGFELFDTKPTSIPSEVSATLEQPLAAGRRYRSRVEVRAGSLRGFLDDKLLVDWDGRGKFQHLGRAAKTPEDLYVSLRAARDVTFHKVVLREVSGTGKLDAGVTSVTPSSATPAGKTIDWLKTPPWNTPWLLKDGMLSTTSNGAMRGLGTMTDGAVRVRVRSTPATRLPGPARPTLQVDLRNGPVAGSKNKTAQFLVQVYPDKRTCSLICTETNVSDGKKGAPEALWSAKPVSSSSATKDEIEWEFRAIGDELSAWADGVLVASVRDPRVPSGSCTVLVETGIEITRLETSGITPDKTAEAKPDLLPNITNWQDVTESVREKARALPGLVVEPGGVRRPDGAPNATTPLSGGEAGDRAVRVRYVGQVQVSLWFKSGGGSAYVLVQRNQTMFKRVSDTVVPESLRPTVPHPSGFDANQPHELLVTVQGPMLRVWLDGRFVGEVQDDAFKETWTALAFMVSSTVQKVEIAEIAGK